MDQLAELNPGQRAAILDTRDAVFALCDSVTAAARNVPGSYQNLVTDPLTRANSVRRDVATLFDNLGVTPPTAGAVSADVAALLDGLTSLIASFRPTA